MKTLKRREYKFPEIIIQKTIRPLVLIYQISPQYLDYKKEDKDDKKGKENTPFLKW